MNFAQSIKVRQNPMLTTSKARANRVALGGKASSNELVKTRNLIGGLFTKSKFGNGVWRAAIDNLKLMNNDILPQKFGNYNTEFDNLYNAVQLAFINANRKDLADNFAATVDRYTEKHHPVDYIATLLKGASNPISVQAVNNQYAILKPLEGIMREALAQKGLATPSDLSDLTQIFYNTFVAKDGTPNEVMNFDQMLPSEIYHVDDSVVTAVVSYVKALSDAKKQGQVLPKFQDKIATAGIKIEEKLQNEATNEVKKEVGGFVVGNSQYIIFGIVAVVLFMLINKK